MLRNGSARPRANLRTLAWRVGPPVAVAALASSAWAFGALAIANLAVRRAAVGQLRVKELHIGHLVVEELEIRGDRPGAP